MTDEERKEQGIEIASEIIDIINSYEVIPVDALRIFGICISALLRSTNIQKEEIDNFSSIIKELSYDKEIEKKIDEENCPFIKKTHQILESLKDLAPKDRFIVLSMSVAFLTSTARWSSSELDDFLKGHVKIIKHACDYDQ